MAELSRHRPLVADLPEQPFQRLLAAQGIGRQEAPGLLRQIPEDRARLEDRHRIALDIVVDDRRHPVVGADRQEFGLELIALADGNRDHGVGQSQFFKQDGDLPAIGRWPIVEVDHTRSSARSAAAPAAIKASISARL